MQVKYERANYNMFYINMQRKIQQKLIFKHLTLFPHRRLCVKNKHRMRISPIYHPQTRPSSRDELKLFAKHNLPVMRICCVWTKSSDNHYHVRLKTFITLIFIISLTRETITFHKIIPLRMWAWKQINTLHISSQVLAWIGAAVLPKLLTLMESFCMLYMRPEYKD